MFALEQACPASCNHNTGDQKKQGRTTSFRGVCGDFNATLVSHFEMQLSDNLWRKFFKHTLEFVESNLISGNSLKAMVNRCRTSQSFDLFRFLFLKSFRDALEESFRSSDIVKRFQVSIDTAENEPYKVPRSSGVRMNSFKRISF